jgi:hypothetical protein
MFNSPVLDLVILLSFTYFVGSLMLSAINESLSALMKTRAKDLKKTLENLLFDDNKEDNDNKKKIKWAAFATNTLFQSQHIKSLMNNEKQFPSYIPAQNFILAIIEQITAGTETKANILDGIDGSPLPDAMKKVLKDLRVKAQANVSDTVNELAAFEHELEGFYNNAMERATGWYKRKVRRIMLVAGFVIAAVLNIDTIKITNDALSDNAKLAKTVDKIIESLPDIKGTETLNISGQKDTVSKSITNTVGIDTLVNKVVENIQDLKIKYNQVGGYQLGYKEGEFFSDWWPKEKGWWNSLSIFFLKIIGLILTAFALQLGSNYWFDLLNKAVNLRATGIKPDQKPKATK